MTPSRPDSPTPPAPEAASTAYAPTAIEAKWYRYWIDAGVYRAERPEGDQSAHVLVMPPPNVTGRLHMGHALQDTVQDALTRVARMRGQAALWMPGLDHAGIATQNVVEKTLRDDEGKTRHDLGREAFVDRVWDWKAQYGDIILQQKEGLGALPDWDRSRFTMDAGFTRAVQEAFVRLFREGLVYRGAYLVNWCPVDQTALSDEEVDNVERDGALWFVRYPIADGPNGEPATHLTIATTRPETILGDTALAVHPDDDRYAHLVGRTAVVPFLGREIPIIADAYVKREFGAGALKITPAHDKNDFEIGERHGLPLVSILEKDGTLADTAGPYAGLDRFEARKQIVADLDAAGLLEKTEPYKVQVPVSSRSKAIVEPLISRQWFVKMAPLAAPAIEAVKDGRIQFHPARWSGEFFRWMDGIRDWTISRQLWWGHRIPVWYFTNDDGTIDETRDFVVSVDRPETDTDGTMVQDADVLDTWFSSWLWPFATLGWPDGADGAGLTDDERADLAAFHPGTVLVSGYDILFFWISRMMMASLHFMGEVPFRHVYLTGIVKDAQGRKMSKSLGNGIDPVDMVAQYGADAVRYSLTVLCTPGQDIKLEPTKFEMGRNFANKVWNAYNVFGGQMEAGRTYRRERSFAELSLVERWIVTRLNQTVEAVDEALARYRVNEALMAVYEFFWNDLCDWYLELIKPARRADGTPEAMDADVLALAVELYETAMQLLHPFMPFITEELWHRLRPRGAGESCAASRWPVASDERSDDAIRTFALVQELISGIRSVRSDYNVPPSKTVEAVVSLAPEDAALVPVMEAHRAYFARLARVETLTVGVGEAKPKASATVVAGRSEVFVPLVGLIDLGAERARLEKEIAQKQAFFASVEKKLSNEAFVARAPAEVIAKERQKMADATAEIDRLAAGLADLG